MRRVNLHSDITNTVPFIHLAISDLVGIVITCLVVSTSGCECS